MMGEVLDFLLAALPWIAAGLLAAVLFAVGTGKKKRESIMGTCIRGKNRGANNGEK